MTRADCSDLEPPWVPGSWWATTDWAARATEAFALPEALERYWLYGEGGRAKIRWGTKGDWRRCRRYLAEHIGPRANGACQTLHRKANGYYTGDKRNK